MYEIRTFYSNFRSLNSRFCVFYVSDREKRILAHKKGDYLSETIRFRQKPYLLIPHS